MKRLKTSIIKVHPITFVYLILSALIGHISLYLSSLFLVFIHEMAHYSMARYFHFEIDKIEILPFGAYLSLKDVYNHDIKEELCVVLAGPATHLFLYYIILFCFKGEYQQYLFTFNSFLFLFNLLPIYPMDGYRILSLLIQSVYDLKKSLYISLKISVFALSVLSLFYFEIETMVIIIYLLQSQFYCYKSINEQLRYVYSHISYTNDNSKRKIIHDCFEYRRGYNNFFIIENKLYNEKDVVFELLKTIKNI